MALGLVKSERTSKPLTQALRCKGYAVDNERADFAVK